MASAELNRRVEKVVGCPPLCDMSAVQRREPASAARRRALRGSAWKWQAAVVAAEHNRPEPRLMSND